MPMALGAHLDTRQVQPNPMCALHYRPARPDTPGKGLKAGTLGKQFSMLLR